MSELFTNPDAAAAAAAAYAPGAGVAGSNSGVGGVGVGVGGVGAVGAIRESPLMKIKLEQQHAPELPHED
ncbi:hypothetical protein KR009_003066 [Drosophila setifemur]|nr:hypothetical protein KR009_003066 [Drosophila setifemur]